MANTVIQLKYSTNTGTTPSGLSNGEIAINTYDGKIFYRDPSGSLQTIIKFTGPAGLNKEIQFNDSGVLGSNVHLTFDKATGNFSSQSVRTGSFIEFSDGSRQYTANAGSGGGSVTSVAGATGAVSNTQILDGIKTVDGSGSGLDADLLDGLDSTSFANSVFAQAAFDKANTLSYPASGIAVSNGTAWVSSTFAGDAVQNLGYLNVPQNAQATNYTLVIGDSAKDIYMAANQAATIYTIPSAANVAFPIGTVISFTNMSANALSIAISSFPSDALYLSSSGATGTRTLAQYGTATMKKVAGLSTNGIWLITGTGLT